MHKPKLVSVCTIVKTLGKGEIRQWTGSLGYQVWWDGRFVTFLPSYENAYAMLEAYLSYHDPEAYEHMKSEKGWYHPE